MKRWVIFWAKGENSLKKSDSFNLSAKIIWTLSSNAVRNKNTFKSKTLSIFNVISAWGGTTKSVWIENACLKTRWVLSYVPAASISLTYLKKSTKRINWACKDILALMSAIWYFCNTFLSGNTTVCHKKKWNWCFRCHLSLQLSSSNGFYWRILRKR